MKYTAMAATLIALSTGAGAETIRNDHFQVEFGKAESGNDAAPYGATHVGLSLATYSDIHQFYFPLRLEVNNVSKIGSVVGSSGTALAGAGYDLALDNTISLQVELSAGGRLYDRIHHEGSDIEFDIVSDARAGIAFSNDKLFLRGQFGYETQFLQSGAESNSFAHVNTGVYFNGNTFLGVKVEENLDGDVSTFAIMLGSGY